MANTSPEVFPQIVCSAVCLVSHRYHLIYGYFILFQSITSKRISTMTVWTKVFFLLELIQSQAHIDIVFLWLAHLNTEFYLHSASSSKHHLFCSLLRSLERKIECKQKIFFNHGWSVTGLHHIVVDVCHNYTNHLLLEYLLSYLTALRQAKLSVQPLAHLWKAALVSCKH